MDRNPTEEIIIAGFGGQGILLAGRLLCIAAMRQGRQVSHIPSYGAEMRGGTASCSVVLSDEDIASPVIDYPTVVIALNEPSVQKFEQRVKAGGLMIWNSSLAKNPPRRKDITIYSIPATDLSIKEGSPKATNMAALGALLALKPYLVSKKAISEAMDEAVTERNRQFNATNRKVLEYGFQYMLEQIANVQSNS